MKNFGNKKFLTSNFHRNQNFFRQKNAEKQHWEFKDAFCDPKRCETPSDGGLAWVNLSFEPVMRRAVQMRLRLVKLVWTFRIILVWLEKGTLIKVSLQWIRAGLCRKDSCFYASVDKKFYLRMNLTLLTFNEVILGHLIWKDFPDSLKLD